MIGIKIIFTIVVLIVWVPILKAGFKKEGKLVDKLEAMLMLVFPILLLLIFTFITIGFLNYMWLVL